MLYGVLMNKRSLYHCVNPDITIDIDAYIDAETGDLVIEGYDIGPRVGEAWGDSDYEYWLRIGRDDKPALYNSLSTDQHCDPVQLDGRLLDLVVENFSNNRAVSLLEEHCKVHQVPAKFSSYV